MRALATIGIFALLIIGGCPQAQVVQSTAVTAEIAYTVSQGLAPLTVTFSAAGSRSENEGALTYLWDFDDGATSTLMIDAHTFENPGRYKVRLTVTDALGEQGIASLTVRAQGGGAVAVISADVTSGPAPLTVQFDATGSQVLDDTILDYFWDFGDGSESRQSQPWHTYFNEGTFTVTLTIETAGGVAADTTAQITVGANNASLQFDGASFASLPLSLNPRVQLTAYAFEAWVKAESEGGTVATIGAADLSIELVPSSNRIRLRIGGAVTDATATSLAGSWRHIAVVCRDASETTGDTGSETGGGTGAGTGDGETQQDVGSCTLYLDGVPLLNADVASFMAPDQITIGTGMRGKVADIRFWSASRGTIEISATMGSRLTGVEPDLSGYWPCDEGVGQTLEDQAGSGDGVLGASTQVENADPAWSTEGPPL